MKNFIKSLATLLMAGATFTACTNDDVTKELMITPSTKTYTLSVKAAKRADTRALTESESTLIATWNTTDVVAVYMGNTQVGTLTPDAATATATLTGEVSGVAVNDVLTLKFGTPDNYATQEGTLEYIDRNCNYAEAAVTVTAVTGTEMTTSDANFVNKQAITKFTFDEEVSKMVIDGGVMPITVTSTASKNIYVAMPATGSNTTYYFTVYMGSGTYVGNKTKNLVNGKFYTAGVDLTPVTEYTDLSANGTANTYMVTAAGKYMFRAMVKGNGGLDPLTGTTATSITGIAGVKVLWELKAQGLAIKHDGTAYDINYADGYVYFSTPDTFTPGDAYVAVYDSEGTILWSWLIWATAQPEETIYDGLIIMGRNLAALGTGNVSCRGLMYEWGRKDPFPCPDNGSYTPVTFVPTRMEAFSIIHTEVGGTVAYTINNPTTYFGWWDKFFWQTEDEFTLDMWWKEAKTIYDPCPPGWKVPSKEEMQKVVSSLVNLQGNGFIGDAQTDFGYGNPWSLYYWTSTGYNREHAWGYYGSFQTNHVDNHTASGYSIRPVKE